MDELVHQLLSLPPPPNEPPPLSKPLLLDELLLLGDDEDDELEEAAQPLPASAGDGATASVLAGGVVTAGVRPPNA